MACGILVPWPTRVQTPCVSALEAQSLNHWTTMEIPYPLSPNRCLLVVKNPPANTGDVKDMGLILGSRRSPGGGHGNPLQYSCLENPMEEPGWLQSIGLQRNGHNWSNLARSGKEPTFQCKRHERLKFDPWVGKIPWKRKWQPTPVFLTGKSHAQRSPAVYSP